MTQELCFGEHSSVGWSGILWRYDKCPVRRAKFRRPFSVWSRSLARASDIEGRVPSPKRYRQGAFSSCSRRCVHVVWIPEAFDAMARPGVDLDIEMCTRHQGAEKVDFCVSIEFNAKLFSRGAFECLERMCLLPPSSGSAWQVNSG